MANMDVINVLVHSETTLVVDVFPLASFGSCQSATIVTTECRVVRLSCLFVYTVFWTLCSFFRGVKNKDKR